MACPDILGSCDYQRGCAFHTVRWMKSSAAPSSYHPLMLPDLDGAMRKSSSQSGGRHRFGHGQAHQKVDDIGALNECSTDDGSREKLSSNGGMEQRPWHLVQSCTCIHAVHARQQLSRMECLKAVSRSLGIQLQMVHWHSPHETHKLCVCSRTSRGVPNHWQN